MENEFPSAKTKLQSPLAKRYRGPIWTLLILAPVIGEVLSGSTRLSVLFVLIPEIMVWGGGALLCRELVRRWRAGGTSLLLLGLALSIAEEFIIQQTSIAPLPFPGVNSAYGRYLGVNWIYLLFMLGFESVWVVLIPVQVTELIFPNHREEPWLRKRGVIATCIAFLIGCRIAWYGWTQQARPRLHAAPYHPPAMLIVIGIRQYRYSHRPCVGLTRLRPLRQIDSRQPAKSVAPRIQSVHLRCGLVRPDRPHFRSSRWRRSMDSADGRHSLGASVFRTRTLLVGGTRMARHPPLCALLRSRTRMHGAGRHQRGRLVTH